MDLPGGLQQSVHVFAPDGGEMPAQIENGKVLFEAACCRLFRDPFSLLSSPAILNPEEERSTGYARDFRYLESSIKPQSIFGLVDEG